MNLESFIFLLSLLIAVSYLSPRVFFYADKNVARQRLSHVQHIYTPSQPVIKIDTLKVSAIKGTQYSLEVFASFFNSLARSLRSSVSSHESLVFAIEKHNFSDPCWNTLSTELSHTSPIEAAIKNSITSLSRDAPTDDLLCLELLLSSTVRGAIMPSAVDQACGILRDVSQCRGDLTVAAAQCRFSSRLLTRLPFALVAIGFLCSSAFRSSFTHVPIILLFLVGVLLNQTGSHVIENIIHKTLFTRAHSLANITDHLCVSLRGGLTLVESCERLAETNDNPITHSIRTALRNGQLLETALAPFETHYGLRGRIVAEVLVEADRDGLPILPTVLRLSEDARNERKHQNDIAIRQLPTRLTVPLVFFVLPSFLILTIAPLMAASLGQLTVSLPSLTPSK